MLFSPVLCIENTTPCLSASGTADFHHWIPAVPILFRVSPNHRAGCPLPVQSLSEQYSRFNRNSMWANRFAGPAAWPYYIRLASRRWCWGIGKFERLRTSLIDCQACSQNACSAVFVQYQHLYYPRHSTLNKNTQMQTPINHFCKQEKNKL